MHLSSVKEAERKYGCRAPTFQVRPPLLSSLPDLLLALADPLSPLVSTSATAPRHLQAHPPGRADAPSPSPLAPAAFRPSQAASTVPTTALDASPAELLRTIASVITEHDDTSDDEPTQVMDELARSWGLLEQVTLTAGRLPDGQDEPGPSRAAADDEAGMKTRGRARKASDRATRGDVEREVRVLSLLSCSRNLLMAPSLCLQLFAAVERLLARTLGTRPTDDPAAALALAAPLLVHLSTSSPRRTLSLLAPPLLAAVHALLFDLLCALPEPHLACAPPGPVLVARLAPTVSLAHLALPAAPTLAFAPPSALSYEPLAHALDALVRLVAGTGVDAQLAAVRLPGAGEDGPSVEAAVLGLLERAWAVRDALCGADEAGEAA